jgi:predicted membrane GTPase involved in stress response
MRLADGVLLVVDALEGVMAVTERAVRQAVAEGLAVTLLISKVGPQTGGGGDGGTARGREGASRASWPA